MHFGFAIGPMSQKQEQWLRVDVDRFWLPDTIAKSAAVLRDTLNVKTSTPTPGAQKKNIRKYMLSTRKGKCEP
jgi:hypothetical protein